MGDMEQILVAISGGIDSTATVLMLREQGYDVSGLYIDMLGDDMSTNRVRMVAQRLGIELYVEDVREEFRHEVIEYTLREHQAGRTPSPCAICNPMIKWAVTQRVADRLGIWRFATGHYVRIIDGFVHKGIDPAKDQSYYLWGLSSDTLHRAITPLGYYTKLQIREYLGRYADFAEMSKGGESMSVCFVGKGSYGGFLRENLSIVEGKVVDRSGVCIGEHSGYQLYTIGQKRGFTGGGAVVGVDPRSNSVITTDDAESLYSDTITVRDWVVHCDLAKWDVQVKVRGVGRNPQSQVRRIEKQMDGMLRVELMAADAWAVAQGQPLVLYMGDMVVGGGIIA